MFIFKTQFGRYICKCIVSKYRDSGALALQLVGAEDSPYEGEPIAMATVNLPHLNVGLTNGEQVLTFIKDWSENQGILDQLVEQNIVRRVCRQEQPVTVPTGYVQADLVEIIDQSLVADFKELP
jgi:hypothetical protein